MISFILKIKYSVILLFPLLNTKIKYGKLCLDHNLENKNENITYSNDQKLEFKKFIFYLKGDLFITNKNKQIIDAYLILKQRIKSKYLIKLNILLKDQFLK